MPALPAGIRNVVPPIAAITTQGWLNQIIGMLRGTKLQPTMIVSRPVAKRLMSQGAAIAPTIPVMPAAASVRPMVVGWKPPWIRRRIARKKIALTVRFTSADQTVSTRKNGRCQMKEKPSRSSSRTRVFSRSTGLRSVRSRPRRIHETA